MRILITGCDGFIGQNLCKAVRAKYPTADITGVDNNWTSSPKTPEQLGINTHVHGDVVNERLFKPYAFDMILHLASPASPNWYQSNPIRTTAGNVIGALNCVDWCRPDGLIFFTSTSEVYGDPVVSPQPESYKGQVDCTGPRACYDESKRVSETIFFDAVRVGRIKNIRIARLFNVYGPGTLPQDGRAVSNFITQAIQDNPITIYGDGTQTRSFTYIDDVIHGIMTFIEQDEYMGPLNIGSDVEESVLHIAWTVKSLANSESEIVHLDPVVDDPQQRRPDLTLARKYIGWNPQVYYADGILRTIDYFKGLMK